MNKRMDELFNGVSGVSKKLKQTERLMLEVREAIRTRN
jgi:hypothetical protein